MNRPLWLRRPAATDQTLNTCGGIEPLLSLYADGMAAPEEKRRVEAHLPLCADCRAALAWMQATHQTLAARPVVAPPANLHARIAEAIAASSAVPARLRPARTFTLRPAYAAAVSLAALGVVLSAALLNHPPPSATAVPSKPFPRVAAGPSSTAKPVVKHSETLIAKSNPSAHSHKVIDAVPPRTERIATEIKRIVPTVPQQVHTRDIQASRAVQTSPVDLPKQAPVRSIRTALLASSKNVTHSDQKHSLVVPHSGAPKTAAPVLEANASKSQPVVPVNIAPPTVTTQPETPRVQMASDIMGDVHASVARMSHAGFATIVKSTGRTFSSTQGFEAEKIPTVDITHSQIR